MQEKFDICDRLQYNEDKSRKEIPMNQETYLSHLAPPAGKIDAILDTDTFNELDDQFALSYMLRATDRICVRAITATPFYNSNSNSPEDGMERSYDEIMKLLGLLGRRDYVENVYKGSRNYLTAEDVPQESAAARHLVELAAQYSPEKPLYVVAIGAIANVASALLMDPSIAEKIVIVWLGGHSLEFCDNKEFNLHQDIAAARVIFGCEAPLIQLPCMGVVSGFATTKPELTEWLIGKNDLSTYLAENTIQEAESYAAGKPWSRVIWDVTAAAWLMNENDRFMMSRVIPVRLPGYDGCYEENTTNKLFRYVYYIKRDALFEDLFKKLTA